VKNRRDLLVYRRKKKSAVSGQTQMFGTPIIGEGEGV